MSPTADPAIAARLAEDLGALASLVDAADITSFMDDRVYVAAQKLNEALEVMLSAAYSERDLRDDDT